MRDQLLRHPGFAGHRQQLLQEALAYIEDGHADTTKKNIGVAMRHWYRFCTFIMQVDWRRQPGRTDQEELHNEFLLVLFATWLMKSPKINSVGTVTTYIGLVNAYHAKYLGMAIASRLPGRKRLRYALNGMRHKFGTAKRTRMALLKVHFMRFRRFFDLDIFNDLMWWSLLVLMFSGLFRADEVSYRSNAVDPKRDLSLASVSFDRDGLGVYAIVDPGACKNDQHGQKSVPLWFREFGGDFSLPSLLQRLIASIRNIVPHDSVHHPAGVPLFFTVQSGGLETVTTTMILDKIRSLLVKIDVNPINFGSHSARLGGFAAIIANGGNHLDVQCMGRWASDLYELYRRVDPARLLHLSKAMWSVSATELSPTGVVCNLPEDTGYCSGEDDT
jgi:hypothetical protein